MIRDLHNFSKYETDSGGVFSYTEKHENENNFSYFISSSFPLDFVKGERNNNKIFFAPSILIISTKNVYFWKKKKEGKNAKKNTKLQYK